MLVTGTWLRPDGRPLDETVARAAGPEALPEGLRTTGLGLFWTPGAQREIFSSVLGGSKPKRSFSRSSPGPGGPRSGWRYNANLLVISLFFSIRVATLVTFPYLFCLGLQPSV